MNIIGKQMNEELKLKEKPPMKTYKLWVIEPSANASKKAQDYVHEWKINVSSCNMDGRTEEDALAEVSRLSGCPASDFYVVGLLDLQDL